ncbi:GFA family protein [Bdellovibrio sp. HCB274]|uniref:GFA family protein n=1 Tax=Bdellovibrio sp. HCB274 TaxID=3394361 RepID=UPI0039B6002C
MVRGSCLCGGVVFEVETVTGPFELCHCSRCRKATGSAFMPAVGVLREGFRFLKGTDLIKIYDAPVRKTPPGYRSIFCGVCGSPVPDPTDNSPEFEIAAGVLDDDPGFRPDKHIFVEVKSPWFTITDDLPQMDEEALINHRKSQQ